MVKIPTSILIVASLLVANCQEETSILDKFLPLYRLIRNYSANFFGREDRSGRNAKELISNRKTQYGITPSAFPCNLNTQVRSETVPTSAHRLRPGDIDVIGAIGDSLTAGFGATATDIVGVFYENRGRSFSIGGEGTWRSYLSLPNILKVFNPNLKGYSLNSLSTNKKSWFNVAEGGAVSKNMPYMARTLVQRMKSDRSINLQENWKMITYMAGDNDFCSEICYYSNYETALKNHKRDLLAMLRIFRDNLPRTIINLIPPPDVKILTQMYDKPLVCHAVHLFVCPCLIGKTYESKREIIFQLMRRWQMIDLEVANLPEFDREDFTVIPHTFTLNYTFPRKRNGNIDYSYLSEDCFHFSQKGHARLANNLWNSLLEPVGRKSIDGSKEFSKFYCPSRQFPYIFTKRNSYNIF